MGGCVALRETHFDPMPCLAQDYKACLCSSWLILRCQESVEVKNPKGGWEETFLCLLADFDLEQMLCQKEAGNPPCAGTASRLHRVLKFPPLQFIVQLCSQGEEAPKCELGGLHSSGVLRMCPSSPGTARVSQTMVCVVQFWDIVPPALAPQLGSSEDHHHQNIGSHPKSLLMTVFSAGTEFTFLTVA